MYVFLCTCPNNKICYEDIGPEIVFDNIGPEIVLDHIGQEFYYNDGFA